MKRMGRFIPCLGTGPEVPAYLRFQGSVRNRNMSKRDAERAVRDIWTKKMLSDRESAGGPRQSMADFFYSYARRVLILTRPLLFPLSTSSMIIIVMQWSKKAAVTLCEEIAPVDLAREITLSFGIIRVKAKTDPIVLPEVQMQ